MPDKPDELQYVYNTVVVSQQRPQLAEFLPSLRAIKGFEDLYRQVNKVIPSALNRVVYEVKEQKFGIDAKNADTVPLPVGTVVIVTEAGPAGAGTKIQRAELTNSLPLAGLGVVHGNDIAVDGYGYFVSYGNVKGLDTSAWVPGAALYLDPQNPGQLTDTRPSLPDRAILVAKCLVQDATDGEIFAMLDEDTDADINSIGGIAISNPQPGDLLIYDGTAGVWKSAEIIGGAGITVTKGDGSVTLSAPSTPSGLEDRIVALETLLANYIDTILSVYSDGTTVKKVVLAKDIPQP